MNRYRMQSATDRWEPKLNPVLIRLLRSVRLRKQRNEQRLLRVDVEGTSAVRELLDSGNAVLITPNHPTHADAYSIYAAAEAIGVPFYLMTAWQVFLDKSWIGRKVLQWHGCFSVDREATDIGAFRQAVAILEKRRQPLVIFPEGEVYHSNARVRPFREGAAAIALTAAKRAKRPLFCLPCAMWYQYVSDPSNELIELMNQLEREILWRPRPELPLDQRIYRLAEVLLTIKELEFLEAAGTGTLRDRIEALAEHVLRQIEVRHGMDERSGQIPERVKELRQLVITGMEQEDIGADQKKPFLEDLDDLFLVVQLYSYPGDYVSERPTIERTAETLDKLEEDVLGRFSATVRGDRRSTVLFGEPIEIKPSGGRKKAMAELTETLEQSVQALIDQLAAGQTATAQ